VTSALTKSCVLVCVATAALPVQRLQLQQKQAWQCVRVRVCAPEYVCDTWTAFLEHPRDGRSVLGVSWDEILKFDIWGSVLLASQQQL
jgi:hypothetical protein